MYSVLIALQILNFYFSLTSYMWYHTPSRCWQEQQTTAPSQAYDHKEKQPVFYSILY